MKIAYLSSGKLFIKTEEDSSKLIECKFAKEAINTAIQVQQQHDWKTKGTGGILGHSAMLWGVKNIENRLLRDVITGVTSGNNNEEIIFALDIENCGGLFHCKWLKDEERRLFHKEHFLAKDLDKHPHHDLICFSQYYVKGYAHIVVSKTDGSQMDDITEGDSMDEAPSWVPNQNRQIVFQSAGIGRTQSGYFRGLGPSSIQKIDLDQCTLDTIVEDEAYDFLLPRMDNEENLYFIRRPYEMPGHKSISPFAVLWDILLFPFRLLNAIFHFLNFFSLAFSKKPLTTAGGPKLEYEDTKTIMLRGKILDAKKMLKELPKDSLTPSFVPASWELIKLSKDGEEELLAKHVLAYDIADDNTVYYTNGTGIFKLTEGTKPVLIHRDKFIEHICIL
jgi:hypothetical protein